MINKKGAEINEHQVCPPVLHLFIYQLTWELESFQYRYSPSFASTAVREIAVVDSSEHLFKMVLILAEHAKTFSVSAYFKKNI